jgi:hypothetical protein
MTTAQKLALVGSVRPVPSRTAIMAALQLPRSTWYYQPHRRTVAERYAHLRGPLEAIARAHPEYGYRRVTVELRDVYGHVLNHKVVQRLQRLWDLPLQRAVRLPRPSGIRQAITAAGDRANLVAALTTIGPFEVLYADFTELRYAGGGKKAALMALVDHATKVAVGWAVGERTTTAVAVQAWQRARRTLRRRGVDLRDRIVHQDRDPVFTGYGWTKQLLIQDMVRLSYTQRGPQDNPRWKRSTAGSSRRIAHCCSMRPHSRRCGRSSTSEWSTTTGRGVILGRGTNHRCGMQTNSRPDRDPSQI